MWNGSVKSESVFFFITETEGFEFNGHFNKTLKPENVMVRNNMRCTRADWGWRVRALEDERYTRVAGSADMDEVTPFIFTNRLDSSTFLSIRSGPCPM
ncbi:hypothetical protein [Paenibacillus lutimineralis]|uniref:hypothetical protein n=1 Tax=Paenibacillus lutimineralis TaxID=2707005 RepID=UPI0013A63B1B|nr:hypothetical protein [Paenibacillus lutimineralis]